MSVSTYRAQGWWGPSVLLLARVEGSQICGSVQGGDRVADASILILFTFALGTAAGDLLAERLSLGYGLSLLLFGGLIVLVCMARFGFRIDPVACFWAAYVLTRPLGASLGDLLSQPRDAGGLGLGTTATSAMFLASILILVAYLTFTKTDLDAEPA